MPNATLYTSQTDEDWPFVFPEYMRAPVAAKYTGHSESTLAKLRMRENRRLGPRFAKRGAIIIYRRSDLDAWMESHLVEGDV